MLAYNRSGITYTSADFRRVLCVIVNPLKWRFGNVRLSYCPAIRLAWQFGPIFYMIVRSA